MSVKNGDTVKVHYRGTLADGTEFDSSEGREPLEFTLGSGMLIPGFEAAVLGLAQGDKTTAVIAPEDGYGPVDEERILVIPASEVPENVQPEEGMVVQLQTEDGGMIDAVVSNVTDTEITLDANHPLAGKELTFEIELVEIC